MSGVDITGGGGAGFQLNRDIYVNNVNEGTYDASKDVKVFLQDGSAVPITPTTSVLVGNDLTITLPTPAPSGVALQFPNPSRGISIQTGDTGWRSQNGWYNYTPPAYPAKYAQLDTTLGANQWYRLKTALTVNGVSSTNRFVDLAGVQGWPALNNLNNAVLDKLTGLMFSRTTRDFANWGNAITNSLTYSVTINGNTYSDWYVPSYFDFMSFFGTYPASPWVDPISALTIIPTLYGGDGIHTSDASTGVATQGYVQTSGGNTFYLAAPNQFRNTFYVHDAKNLIS
jgi:hypothetical protein